MNQLKSEKVIEELFKDVDPDVMKLLTTKKSMTFYDTAFTNESYDQYNNYEFFKALGEMTMQQCAVWYCIEKFPQIFNPQRKTIVTDLKRYIMNGAIFISHIGDKIGPLILFEARDGLTTKSTVVGSNSVVVSPRIIFEVIQAIFGVTEWLLNKAFGKAESYKIIYNTFSSILNKAGITIDYNLLVDGKTLINASDFSNKIVYKATKIEDNQGNHTHKVVVMFGNQELSVAEDIEKVEAEKKAAKLAIPVLEKINNYKFQVPNAYKNIKNKITNNLSVDQKTLLNNIKFKDFIESVINQALTVSKFGSREKINVVATKEDISVFVEAMTHVSVSTANYEIFETLGDNTLNKCIVWYISERFPQLNGPGVAREISSKLKISLVNEKTLCELATELGLSPFILWNKNAVDSKGKSYNFNKILEDVFESFFCAVEYTTDASLGRGYGYELCYAIIKILLDKRDLNLRYEFLVDNKTVLKEIFDRREINTAYGTLTYTKRKSGENFISEVFGSIYGRLGVSDEKSSVKEAESDAAKKALILLASMNIYNYNSEKYDKFNI